MTRSFSALSTFFRRTFRRRSWVFDQLSVAKLSNLALSLFEYGMHRKRISAMPSIVKIDISPLCALQCPTCLHADAHHQPKPLLEAQAFHKTDKMSVADFSAVIDQIKDKALAVSLYYFGDPLMHPQLDELCGIARAAGLNVHMTSHFSYNLTDERIARLARCGATHITVALDGASQEIYARTRVRGRLDWVVANLTRLTAYKRQNGLHYPFVEVQYIRHPHHRPDEEQRVRQIAKNCGIDKFTTIRRYEYANVVDEDPSEFNLGPGRKKGLLPKCALPYTSTVIKHNGDVIPCCNHRAGRQYANLGGEAIAGNIFKQPFTEIWNSKAYQDMRRFVSDPPSAESDAAWKDSFCFGCAVLSERTRRTEDNPKALPGHETKLAPYPTQLS